MLGWSGFDCFGGESDRHHPKHSRDPTRSGHGRFSVHRLNEVLPGNERRLECDRLVEL
jgi:hypothetical protein